MAEIKYNIEKRVGTIQTNETGWSKELNIVSWNEGVSKYDIREWNEDHTHMSRGITLHEEEARTLLKILQKHFKEVK